MSRSNDATGGIGLSLLIFILVKVAGTAFATWSWLWILFPIIPVLWLILHALGMM